MNNLIKTKIIELVKLSKNDELLNQIYNILDNNINYKDTQLFEQLSEYQKKEKGAIMIRTSSVTCKGF